MIEGQNLEGLKLFSWTLPLTIPIAHWSTNLAMRKGLNTEGMISGLAALWMLLVAVACAWVYQLWCWILK